MNLPLRQVAYERFKSRLFDGSLTPGAFVTALLHKYDEGFTF